jgi:phosphatidylglycerol:prolipoprotein diacylglycerol transferase
MYYYHPTFLYESVWNLAGFVLLHFLSKKRKFDGQMALMYVAWYGLGRTFIEGLRTDSLMMGPVRVSQLLAALSCFAAVVVLLVVILRKPDPAKLFVNVKAAQAAQEQTAVAENTEE